ncbi:hypothetical protein [Nocardia salmonicida]|uniref:hypothetical protein n=1 Tax=Nocardia salmonicida TaxID=53431 RepID=UPI0033FC24A9
MTWTETEMDSICLALRAETANSDHPVAGRRRADAALLDQMETEVDDYNDQLAKLREGGSIEAVKVPPDDIRTKIWLLGWMLYEASYQLLQQTRADDGEEIVHGPAALIRRLSELASILPWPHFGPRALGAIRADALVASKRDTAQGYREAFLLHEDADTRYHKYLASHGTAPDRENERLGLEEIRLQLVLAETGTACRAMEQIVGRWLGELERDELHRQWHEDDEDRLVGQMFDQLAGAVLKGEHALDTASEIGKRHKFAPEVTRERLALRTALRGPAIMTARAALHMLPLSYEMEDLGARPGMGHSSWSSLREATVARFRKAYRMIEEPVPNESGGYDRLPLSRDHTRSIVQLRLNAALLLPGIDLQPVPTTGGIPAHHLLDEHAVEALSAWLGEKDGKGRLRGNSNAIGSATMAGFIRGVEASRTARGQHGGYRVWRRKWFELDRYLDEGWETRRRQVWRALGEDLP